MTISTGFSVTLDTDGDGLNGFTIVVGFAVAAFTLPSGAITGTRVTFRAGNVQGLTITNAYIGHAAGSGDAYDFDTTPVQLLWSGSGTKAIAANSEEATDLSAFAYNKTSNLLVAYYMNGGTTVDNARYKLSVANVTDYNKVANDAATVNKTGYSATALCRAIKKIEFESDDGTSIVFFF